MATTTLSDYDIFDIELIRDDYRVIYGILYNDVQGSADAYDVIASTFNSYNSQIQRKATMMRWQRIIQTAMKRMDKAMDSVEEDTSIEVNVPFLDYCDSVKHTRQIFLGALDVIELLLETDGKEELPYSDEVALPTTMFEDMETFMINANEGECGLDSLWGNAIANEMIDRGLLHKDKFQTVYSYRESLVGTFKPKADKKPVVSRKGISNINKVGVLYYMLKDSVVDIKTMNRIAHYFLVNEDEFKGTNGSNDSIYTYISHPERLTDKQDKIDYIKEQLAKYGFDEGFIAKHVK